MDELRYSLMIDVDKRYHTKLDDLFQVESNTEVDSWEWVINVDDNTHEYPIDEFLVKLRTNMEPLSLLNVKSNNITVWITYGYSGQCNFEFEANTLKSLGELGIDLCISCYQQ